MAAATLVVDASAWWMRCSLMALHAPAWPRPACVQALLALDTAQLLGLRRHATRQLWPRAWQLRSNLSAYDALYVALAEQLNLSLLSADGRLARAPGLRCQVRVVQQDSCASS